MRTNADSATAAMGQITRHAEREFEREDQRAAIHNLSGPINDLRLVEQQLGETGWAQDIARIRGELALIFVEVESDLHQVPDPREEGGEA